MRTEGWWYWKYKHPNVKKGVVEHPIAWHGYKIDNIKHLYDLHNQYHVNTYTIFSFFVPKKTNYPFSKHHIFFCLFFAKSQLNKCVEIVETKQSKKKTATNFNTKNSNNNKTQMNTKNRMKLN